MIIVKDSMVLIHLAKLTILEKSCDSFTKVLIPEAVKKEIMVVSEDTHAEMSIIKNLIDQGKIQIKPIINKELIKKINQFNIQRGEAEVIALYWQEKADLIATDDDNVRKKKLLLNIKIIGTPPIILRLYKQKIIDKKKLKECVTKLKNIGWFHDAILDNLLVGVGND